MALRLIEVYVKEGMVGELRALLGEAPVLDTWQERLSEGMAVIRLLLRTEHAERVTDSLERRFSGSEGFRVVMLHVEATIPRPVEPEEEKERKPAEKSPERIHMEELYQKLTKECWCRREFLVMVALASFVAAIGLIKNDMVVVIGSMVIAPLLAPNMALSLATTLADSELARRSLLSIAVGFSIAIFTGVLMGLFVEFDPTVREISVRSNISHYYIALALASGVAGSYSLTTGVAEALVGVMVAVALLPPIVASGLLFGAGQWKDAMGAMLLFGVNIVSVNLSGVVTFVMQGIRPKRWWEAEKARKAVRAALALWVLLLGLLALLIILARKMEGAIG